MAREERPRYKPISKLTGLMPFVTGSHAYGLPEGDSDIDLVVLVTKRDFLRLLEQADPRKEVDPEYEKFGSVSLRFGKLNIICCYDEKMYRVWRKGTQLLKKQAPVSRAFACKFFDKLRAKASVHEPAPKQRRKTTEDAQEGDF